MRFNKINPNIDLPVYEEGGIETLYRLFQCVKCGIHAKAYSLSIAKGDDSKTLVQLLNVLPGKTEVIEVFGEILNDTEIIETVFCGKCSSAGYWTEIPSYLLEYLGMVKPENNNEKSLEQKNETTAENSGKLIKGTDNDH